MLRTPRSLAICLVLLFGMPSHLHAQATPAPTWNGRILQNFGSALSRVYPSSSNTSSPAPAPSVATQNGVFFLRERVAVTTKAGVLGLNPGTGVRLVSENGNSVSVTDGTTTFDVPKDKLTANINEANVTAQNYYASEQAGAEAFNAEVVRQQQEQKRALDQRVAAAAQQREQEIHQQQAAERQAPVKAQRQHAASSRTAANRTDPLNLKNIHRGLDGHIMFGTASNGVNAAETRAREQHQRRRKNDEVMEQNARQQREEERKKIRHQIENLDMQRVFNRDGLSEQQKEELRQLENRRDSLPHN